MRLLRNFLAWDSRAASGLQDERNKADMEMSIKFDFLCSFLPCDLGEYWLQQ